MEYVNPDRPTDNSYGYLSRPQEQNPLYYYRGGFPYQGGYDYNMNVSNPFQQNRYDSRRDMPLQQPPQQNPCQQLNGFIENSNPYGGRYDVPNSMPNAEMYRGYYGNYQNMMDGYTIPPFTKKDIWSVPDNRLPQANPMMNIDWNAADRYNQYNQYYGQRSYIDSPFSDSSATEYSAKADRLFK